MAFTTPKYPLVDKVRQSSPLALNTTYEENWIKGRTLLITGAVGGIGSAFVKRWAAAGAVVVASDINTRKGETFVLALRQETGNQNIHFVHCDVCSWPSQVNLFKEAVKLSPHGGIDMVFPNAGIADGRFAFENPVNLDAAEPPPPDLSTIDVNLVGVLYTTHLALFYLSRNPGSVPADPRRNPAQLRRDRHLLLIGSVASLVHLPYQPLYGSSKHAILGLFRCLRSSSFVHGIRVNLICPHFIDSPLLTPEARVVLAGAPLGSIDSVVEAGTRFTADARIAGRALVVGPKFQVEEAKERGMWKMVERSGGEGGGASSETDGTWEVYSHDFENSEVWQRRFIETLNAMTVMRGWSGWVHDLIHAATLAFRSLWKT